MFLFFFQCVYIVYHWVRVIAGNVYRLCEELHDWFLYLVNFWCMQKIFLPPCHCARLTAWAHVVYHFFWIIKDGGTSECLALVCFWRNWCRCQIVQAQALACALACIILFDGGVIVFFPLPPVVVPTADKTAFPWCSFSSNGMQYPCILDWKLKITLCNDA